MTNRVSDRKLFHTQNGFFSTLFAVNLFQPEHKEKKLEKKGNWKFGKENFIITHIPERKVIYCFVKFVINSAIVNIKIYIK